MAQPGNPAHIGERVMTKASTKRANADFVVAIGGKKVIVKGTSAVQEAVSTTAGSKTSTKAAIAKVAQTATASTAIGAALVAATIADNIANNESVTPVTNDMLIDELVDCFRGDYDTRETVRKSYSRTLQSMINAGIAITKDVQNACFIGSMMGKFHVTKDVATAWLTQEGAKERPADFKRHGNSFRQTWKRVLDAMGIKPLSNAGGANNPGKKAGRAARPGSNAIETDGDDMGDEGDETPATHAARAPVKWDRVEDAIVAFKREAAALAQGISVNLGNESMKGPKASALRYALKAFQSAILAAETASDDMGEEVATIVAPVVAHVTKTLPVITLKSRTSRGH